MNLDALLLSLVGTFVALGVVGLTRGASWLHPARLYAVLLFAHFFLPGVLIGLDLAPRFVNVDNERFLQVALIFALLCLVAAALGAAAAQRLRLGWTPWTGATPAAVWDPRRVHAVILALLIASWAVKAYVIESNAYFQVQRAVQGELEGPFYALVRMVEQFSLFAIVILCAQYWGGAGKTSPRSAALIVFLSAAELFYWLPAGRKEESILCLLLPLAARYLFSGRLPSRKAMLALVAFVALLFPLSHYYRVAIELNLGQLSASDAVSLVDLASSSAGTAEASAAPAQVTFNRISLLEPVAASMRLITTNQWPLLWGASYGELVLTVVPRVLWPGKPDFHYGNDFGHAAGFLSPGDDVTSISVSYVGESFLNLAWMGWAAIAAVALFYGLLYHWARSARDRLTAGTIYLLALPRLLYIGGTFALDFGGMLKLLPFFFLICVLLRRSPSN